jgi:RNA polymerase sigma-70 factor, ECF subfamily
MLTDEKLYARLLRGDLAAFDELYRRYEVGLFGFIVSQLSDRAEAEDVFHEAFMTVLREGRAGGEVRSFRAWIFEVARHLCLNRRRSKERAQRALEKVVRDPPEPPLHPESILEAREAPEALGRALAKLPRPLVEMYELRRSGLSYEEIAQLLGIPLGTVKSRMHETMSKLRKEIQPWIVK